MTVYDLLKILYRAYENETRVINDFCCGSVRHTCQTDSVFWSARTRERRGRMERRSANTRYYWLGDLRDLVVLLWTAEMFDRFIQVSDWQHTGTPAVMRFKVQYKHIREWFMTVIISHTFLLNRKRRPHPDSAIWMPHGDFHRAGWSARLTSGCYGPLFRTQDVCSSRQIT